MKLEIDLEPTVAAAIKTALDPERVRAKIEETVTKTIDAALNDAFRDYSDFGKTVKAAVSGLVPHSLDIDGSASFTHALQTVLQQRIRAFHDERIKQAIEPILDKLLAPAPESITLDALCKMALEEWRDSYKNDHAERMYLHVEESDSADGYKRIYMDPNGDKFSGYGSSHYGARVHIAINRTGEVYRLKIEGKDVQGQLFAGPFYDFERMIFHFYTGKTKIIVGDSSIDTDSLYYGEPLDD